MARRGERKGQEQTSPEGGQDAGRTLHGAARHPDDPWYQPESGVPRDPDEYEHPPLSEDD